MNGALDWLEFNEQGEVGMGLPEGLSSEEALVSLRLALREPPSRRSAPL